jgi:Ca2+-transporting ATPase
MNFHYKTIPEIYNYFKSDERGLDGERADNLLKEYGPNELPAAIRRSLGLIFLEQFKSPLIYILLAAGFIVALMGELSDALIISFVLIFNSIVGTIQEGRAQNTLDSLNKIVKTRAVVLRNGREEMIDDTLVVPGDIILLKEGDRVPADARVIVTGGLKVNNASLTGESEPVEIITEPLGKNAVIAERRNMLYKGAMIVRGTGKAIVTATGLDSEIGSISQKIEQIDSELPLKANIKFLSRLIIIIILIVAVIIFAIGLLAGNSIKEMLATVIALSISVIPEGLPIVMTLVLAQGVKRMSRQNALVKRLQAVEALGQAEVIAVDKTGTITKNEMMITEIFANEETFLVDGEGYGPTGNFLLSGSIVKPSEHLILEKIGLHALFAAHAGLYYNERKKEWEVSGDPTEAALLVLAKKIGLDAEKIRDEMKIVSEFPFGYKHKFYAARVSFNNELFFTAVGAPEVILQRSKSFWHDGELIDLSDSKRKDYENIFQDLSTRGLRVLALASASQSANFAKRDEVNNLGLLGFTAMEDSLREDAVAAIAEAKKAGIKVIMITGDNKITAEAIAAKAHIFHKGDEVITGEMLAEMSEDDLARKIGHVSIYARVAPDDKLKIINGYRKSGQVIAMTGDGVNDAPSLVAADLGIAMGRIGTEVAKDASDIVLLDDNFKSIVAAIEEGRHIYQNIKRVILYLFSTSIGELLTIAGAIALSWPLPILPAQIIWLNLVTDGFLDVALSTEKKEAGLLRQKFTKPKKYIVDSLMAKRMAVMAVPMFAGALFIFSRYFAADIEKGWTATLTALAVFQWFNAWNCRSETKSVFKMSPFGNKYLVGATLIVIALQIAAIYAPFMQKLLHTVPLNLSDWLAILAVGASIIIFEEIRKFFYRRSHTNGLIKS